MTEGVIIVTRLGKFGIRARLIARKIFTSDRLAPESRARARYHDNRAASTFKTLFSGVYELSLKKARANDDTTELATRIRGGLCVGIMHIMGNEI